MVRQFGFLMFLVVVCIEETKVILMIMLLKSVENCSNIYYKST